MRYNVNFVKTAVQHLSHYFLASPSALLSNFRCVALLYFLIANLQPTAEVDIRL